MIRIPFIAASLAFGLLVSCQSEKKIVRVEGRDLNGHPGHFFSYYVNEKGDTLLHGAEIIWSSPDRKQVETHWKDGRKNGMFSRWYPNGKLQEQRYFRNDSLDSVLITYFENGQMERKTQFKNFKADGLDQTWDSTGQLLELMTYKDGRMEGPWIIWHQNGRKRMEQEAKDGQIDGIRRHWDEQGRLVSEVSNVNGIVKGLQTYWYPNGKVQRKFIRLESGRHDGPDSSWYETGELEFAGFWKNEQRDGYMTHWDKQGHKLEETIVKDGKATTRRFDKGGKR